MSNTIDPTDENDDPFAGDDFDEADSASPLGDYQGVVNDEEDALFDEYEIPQTPIGVLEGFVASARYADTEKDGKTKRSLVLDIQCKHLDYQNSETVSIWLELPKDISRAMKCAKALGMECATKIVNGRQRVALPRPPAWVNKAGMFVFCTWTNKQDEQSAQIARFGVPKEGSCAQFDSWAKDNLTPQQLKAVKGYGGVCPLNVLEG